MKAINLDITHRCTLACPKCPRQYYIKNNMKVPGKDMTIDEYYKIISHFNFINFCGNLSDPIFNPHFIEFLKINYKNNIGCEIHTAATGKSLEWYKKAFEANPNAHWKFAIDGYPEESHFYRKNQNGEALFQAMKLCKEMGLKTTWEYIIFKYNEYSIEDCKIMAKHLGVDINLIKSGRFKTNDPLKPLDPNNYIRKDYEKDLSQMYKE